MKARDTDFLELLEGKKQFTVPIFQRRYSWEKTQCLKLWKDVLRLGQSTENLTHFLGSIVYIEPGVNNASGVRELHVIDGQQRLTTLTLLLAALSRAIKARDGHFNITPEEVSDYYLNDRRNDEFRYKQMLTQHDRETLIHLVDDNNWFKIPDNGSIRTPKLLENDELPDYVSPRLLENYRLFEFSLNDVDLQTVYNGIQKLKIVDIALKRDHDNPQLIFESLNSTGLSLSQADLIRNYVLMGQGADFQNRLYQQYWLPMEQSFGNEYTKRFDRFIRDYLTLKTQKIPNVRSVYEKFKEHLPTIEDAEKLKNTLEEISCYAKHYVNMALLEETDPVLQQCFKDIQELRMEVAFPLLLEVYEDYKKERINKSEIKEILRLVESYVFRRAICGIPTNSLNKTFAAIMMEKDFDKNRYLESLKNVFVNMVSYRRFPSDHEFKREFLIKDVYHFDRCNYLLRRLENYGRREMISVMECSIEHIMPQNSGADSELSKEWKQELGEEWRDIHRNYLHTIGNLTLIGRRDNPSISNQPFKIKQTMEGGFCNNPLLLNRSVAKAERWNENAIQERAEELAEKALQIWRYPELTDI